MKKIITLLAIACTVGMTSCKKEFQKYEGPTQIALSSAYTVNATPDGPAITFPLLQLISTEAQPEVTATLAVNAKTTCAAAVTVPTGGKIDAGRFIGEVVVAYNYATLKSETLEVSSEGSFSLKGNANTLIFDLTESSIKIAPNFAKSTIKIVPVQAAIKSGFTIKALPTTTSLNIADVLALYPAAPISAATTYTLSVDEEASTCAAAVTVPTTAEIAAKSTKGSIAIDVDYSALADETWTEDKEGELTVLEGNNNILVLDIVSTTGVRMSNLTKITIKIVKQKPAEE